MTRRAPPTHIDIAIEDVEDDNSWFDEKTARFDFDKKTLTAEDRLVIGYLTMEANGLFGHLSVDEQLRIARAQALIEDQRLPAATRAGYDGQR